MRFEVRRLANGQFTLKNFAYGNVHTMKDRDVEVLIERIGSRLRAFAKKQEIADATETPRTGKKRRLEKPTSHRPAGLRVPRGPRKLSA